MPNEISVRSEWERSSTRSFLGYLISRRFLRKLLFGCALLITVVALYYAFENWRGKRAWRQYRSQLVAQGVNLDIHSIVQPPVPDDQNFAATPFFAALFAGKPSATNSDDRWPDLFEKAQAIVRTTPNNQNPARGERRLMDLPAWQMAFRKVAQSTNENSSPSGATRSASAEEILQAIKIYDPVLDELNAASKRPLSRYKVVYDLENPWGILLPHLKVAKRTCELLQLKASAELAKGDTEAAFNDLNLMLRLIESLQSEPFVISHLVRIACLHITAQTLWEGMVLERWSDGQLSQLQPRLLSINFIADQKQPFECERVAGFALADLLERNKRQALSIIDSGTTFPITVLAWIAPQGWFEFERLNFAKLFEECILPSPDPARRTISPDITDSNERKINAATRNGPSAVFHHMMLCRLLIPAISNIHKKTAYGQTTVHEAVIACALERFRIANNQYPADLTQLVPKYLNEIPNDPIGGQPLKYKAQPSPTIYSIGWDQKDSGGAPAKSFGASEGDWVWSIPRSK